MLPSSQAIAASAPQLEMLFLGGTTLHIQGTLYGSPDYQPHTPPSGWVSGGVQGLGPQAQALVGLANALPRLKVLELTFFDKKTAEEVSGALGGRKRGSAAPLQVGALFGAFASLFAALLWGV